MGALVARLLRFFVDPPLSTFVSFVFSLSVLLGVFVLLPPQHLSLVVSVGCFVVQSGETLFCDDFVDRSYQNSKLKLKLTILLLANSEIDNFAGSSYQISEAKS